MFKFYLPLISDITVKMEADSSPKAKREKRTPKRFQPWKEGDPHSPMAVRRQKSQLKKEQKKFREMKKMKEAAGSAKEGTSEEDAVQGPNKQDKVQKKTNKKVKDIKTSSKKSKDKK